MNWNGLFGILSNDNEHAEYEDVYNENGDAVYCDSCGEEIRWKDGIYFCMGCGKRMSRQVFLTISVLRRQDLVASTAITYILAA